MRSGSKAGYTHVGVGKRTDRDGVAWRRPQKRSMKKNNEKDKMTAKKPRTSEELVLLIGYLSLIGIWFAIPSLNLVINRDKRWPYALVALCFVVIILLIAYLVQWEVLFPRSATENDPVV